MRTLSALLILITLLPTAARPQAPPDTEQAVRAFAGRFIALLAGCDPAPLLPLLTTSERNRKGMTEYFTAVMKGTREGAVKDVRLDALSIDDDLVRLRAWFVWEWFEIAETRRVKLDVLWDIALSRELGEWRFYAFRETRDWLYDKLTAELDAAKRRSLLDDNRSAVAAWLPFRLRDNASTLANDGKFDEALRLNALAFEVAGAIGTEYERGYCHVNRAYIRRKQQDINPALRDLEAARVLFEKIGDQEGLAKAFSSAALIYERQALYARAETMRRDSLAARRKLGDDVETGNALQDLSVVLQRLERPGEAIVAAEEAIALFRKGGFLKGAAACIGNIASCLNDLGRYGDSLAKIDEAWAIHREIKNTGSDAVLWTVSGSNYEMLGQRERALDCGRKAEAAARVSGNKRDLMIAIHNQSSVLADMRRNTEAMSLGNQVIELAREINDQEFLSQVYGAMAQMAINERLHDLALRIAQSRLDVSRENKSREQEAGALLQIARALDALKKPLDARKAYDEAVKVAEATGSAARLRPAYAVRGLFAARRGEWTDAARDLEAAAQYLERSRDEVREQSLKAAFLEDTALMYSHLIAARYMLRDTLGAFVTSEKVKARGLVDLLQGGKVDLSRTMSAEERSREDSLRAQLVTLARNVERAAGTDEREALLTERAQTRKALEEFRVGLYLRRPELRVRRSAAQSVTLAEIDRALLSRSPGTAIVSYSVATVGLLQFVIRRGASGRAVLVCRRLNVDWNAMINDIVNLWSECSVAAGKPSPLARRLYRQLIKPALGDLAGVKHLVIVPDLTLHTLPFAALEDASGEPLIRRFAISYSPSVTALIQMQGARASRGTGQWSIAAFGSPSFSGRFAPLPATLKEVRAIGAVVGKGAQVVTGDAATEARARELAPLSRMVHFATHGTLNQDVPMDSGIVLTPDPSNDGVLQAREIADLSLAADLAVLSACETALGQRVRGEGVLGLTWALLVGGARSVVASQWQVHDDSTRSLMVSFYRTMTAHGGGDRAEALRRAQLALRANPKLRHPYYWAPFLLTGAWQ